MSDYVPGCTGKKWFRFRGDAQKAKKRQPERHLHVYFCGSCGMYHLTSSSESRASIEERRANSK